MSAYTNPETYIDTQSAQHLQNLQSTIAGSFARVAESYASNQERLKKQLEANAELLKNNNLKADEYGLSLYKDVSKASASDTSVNWSATFDPLISKAVKLRSGLLNGTLADKQGAMRELADIESSVDGITGILADLSSTGKTLADASSKGVMVQGGIASSNNASTQSATLVLQGKLNGSKRFYFEDDNPRKPMVEVLDDKGNRLQAFSGEQLKKISQGNGELIRVIPDQTPAFDTLKNTNSDIFESAPVKQGKETIQLPTGRIKEAFLVKGKPKEVEVASTKGERVTKLVQDVDIKTMMLNGGNLDTTIRAQAKGLLANTHQAIDFYNDIMGQKIGTWEGIKHKFDPDQILTDKDKARFAEDYKTYFVETQIPKTQDVLKPEGDIFTTTYETAKPEKLKKDEEGKEKEKKESIESVVKRIGNTKLGDIAEFTYNGRKVSYDGGNFLVERTPGLKDLVFDTKAKVINYLKTGGTSKPNP